MNIDPTHPPDRWWNRTILLIAVVTLGRILYLAFLCPYTLIEDEAHYWEWSRHLALSYYTKGPGVAWTIAASTRLLGETEFAVRLPAALSSAVLALAVASLTRDTTRSPRAAFFGAACVFLVPIFQLLGLMMTIDGPYAACWAAAMWAGWRTLGQRRVRYLPMVGLALGIGFLYKYTILLAIPGLAASYLFLKRPTNSDDASGETRQTWIWFALLGLILFLLGISPIIAWNARNGWPTIAHLLGHLGVKGGDVPVTQGAGHWHYNPKWTLEYVGAQLGMVGPAMALAAMQAARAWRTRHEGGEAARAAVFLIANSLPILLFYLLVSFLTEPEGNWPLAGYITLMPLAGLRVHEGLDELREKTNKWLSLDEPRPWAGLVTRRPTNLTRVWWSATLAVGIVVGLAVPRLDLVASLPIIGRYIPVHRFTGADRMAAHVQRLLDRLRHETANEPFVVANHYGRASQLAFYLPGRPVVYCSSSLMKRGRRNQYDYWPDTDLRNASGLVGLPAVAIGATLDAWGEVFERTELEGRLDADGKTDRPAFRAYGFKGFAAQELGSGVSSPDLAPRSIR